MKQARKVALLILDGWGFGKKDQSDAIFQAKTPVFDKLMSNSPHASLLTDGEHVGLPKGQMGNSEVGHLNIGAGRVVYQDLVKINRAIASGEIADNKALNKAFKLAKEQNKALHFIGLVSDGGIHSHIDHLFALIDLAESQGIQKSFVHAFTDGRDTDPHSGVHFIDQLKTKMQGTSCRLASIVGRYFAMDRDLRWERIQKAYNALVHGKGNHSEDLLQDLQSSYEAGISDEFVEPILYSEKGEAIAKIENGDVVICFNYRTDRCREITRALSQESFHEHGMHPLDLHYVTMTNYDDTFRGIEVLFRKENLKMTLGEAISKSGKSQVRIAETEKYPHVSFFFSGGREQAFDGEKRIMVNSPKVATYDLQPEMSAPEVCEQISQEMREQSPDFICLNFANPDMVGHTGVFSAIVKAVETVDGLLGKIINLGRELDYSFVIIADHGNADFAINTDGSPNTAHTTNPVPIIVLDPDTKKVADGILADVAPSILKIMQVPIPKEMNGKVLI